MKGQLPKKPEIADWSEEKILSFIRFTLFFTEPAVVKGKDTYKFVVDAKKWQQAVLNKDEEYWDEFCKRINKGSITLQKMKLRMLMMVRTVLGWLKSNPYAITEEMENLMKDNPRTSWALRSYKTETTPMGTTLTLPDNTGTTESGSANNAPVSTPEVQYKQAVLRMTSILNSLTKGIKKDDIDMMSAKEKIQMAVSLSKALTSTFKSNSVNNNFFKQVVINTASREDLEAKMNEYANQQMSDE